MAAPSFRLVPRHVRPASTTPIQPSGSRHRDLSTTVPTRAHISPPPLQTHVAHPSPSTSLSRNQRVYTPRKTFLFSHYAHLLENSSAVLIFQHNNLSSRDLANVKKALASVAVPRALLKRDGVSGASEAEKEEEVEGLRASFLVARTGVLAAVVEEREKSARIAGIRARSKARASEASSGSESSSTLTSSRSTSSSTSSMLPLLSGPTALLTLPTLSPSYIRALLSSLNKSFSFRPPASSSYASISPTSPSVPVPSQLILLGALLESSSPTTPNAILSGQTQGKIFSAAELIHFSERTPELRDLQAQLIGLLSGGGAGVVGVLGQAGGGGLIRTLMGLEEGLRAKSGDGPEAKAA